MIQSSLQMFNSTNWKYQEPTEMHLKELSFIPEAIVKPPMDYECSDFYILSQFPFMSSLQRSSVICKENKEGSDFEVYCKGSPEAIVALSDPNTVPKDIFLTLKKFTTKGYRVLAMGTRILEATNNVVLEISREDIEKNLSFTGLIVLENKLKIQTTATIKELKKSGMKIMMITGDNMQTAVSVAKECGVIDIDSALVEVIATDSTKQRPKIRYNSFDTDSYVDAKKVNGDYLFTTQDIENVRRKYQFVLTGKTWSNITEYFPETIPDIMRKGAVFARISSNQKQQLIEELKNLGYYVAMCGDGANDCAALKAAHLGISLSEAEASIAAPFTSKESNISCVPMIIREGRAALITSFGVFKFIVCGSLAEFFCTIILYGIDCNLSSMQFLFLDIVLQLNLATFFGNTEACRSLHNKPPLTSILSFLPLTSMVLFMILTVGFQIFAFYFVRTFSWYEPFVYIPHVTNISKCQENFSIFVITMFQYIAMAVLFSKGKPYREPLYTNKKFSGVLIITTFICCYLTLYPPYWIEQFMEMNIPTDVNVRIQLLTLASVNFMVAFLAEEILVDLILEKIIYCCSEKKLKTNIYVEDVNLTHKQTVININETLSEEDKYNVTRC